MNGGAPAVALIGGAMVLIFLLQTGLAVWAMFLR